MTIVEHSFEFVDTYIPEYFETGATDPLYIFVSGPQGSGKTYTSRLLYDHLVEKYKGERKVALTSIDDFYLTHDDQLKLSKTFSKNKLLQGRGLPGTHDMNVLNDVLNAVNQKRGNNLSLIHI